MTVLDVFSWLPAKEISIEKLEQIFIGHLNGTYKGGGIQGTAGSAG